MPFVKRFFDFFEIFFSLSVCISLPLTLIIIADLPQIARWYFAQNIGEKADLLLCKTPGSKNTREGYPGKLGSFASLRPQTSRPGFGQNAETLPALLAGSAEDYAILHSVKVEVKLSLRVGDFHTVADGGERVHQNLNNFAFRLVGLALSRGEFVHRGLAGARPRVALGNLVLCGGQVMRGLFAVVNRLVIREDFGGFGIGAFQPRLDAGKLGFVFGHVCSFLWGGEGVTLPRACGLPRKGEQGLALHGGLRDRAGLHELTHQSRDLLVVEVVQLVHTAGNLGAGLPAVREGEELADEGAVTLVRLLRVGELAGLGAVLAGEQLHLVSDEGLGILDGRAVLDGLAVNEGQDVLETLGLGDALSSVFHSRLPFWFVLGVSFPFCDFIVPQVLGFVKTFFHFFLIFFSAASDSPFPYPSDNYYYSRFFADCNTGILHNIFGK